MAFDQRNAMMPARENMGFAGMSAGAAQEERGNTLRQVGLLLRGRVHYAVILALVLGVIGGVLGFFSEQPLYRSTAKIRINPVESSPMDDDRVRPRFEEYLMTQVEVIRSSEVVKQAMRHPLWTASQTAKGQAQEVTRDLFQERMYLYRPRRLEVITVGFDAPDAETSLAGTQAIVEAYKDVHQQREEQYEGERLEQLRSYINKYENQLKLLEERKYAFSVQYGLDTIEDRDRQLQDQISRAQMDLQQITLEIAIQSGGTGQDLTGDGGALSIPEIAPYDTEIQRMLGEKDRLEQQLRMLQARGLGETHRQVVDLRAQIASIDESIEERVRLIQSGAMSSGTMINPIARLRVQEREYKKYIEELQERQAQLGQVRRKVAEINEQIDETKALLTQARDDQEKRRLSASIRGEIEDVSSANQPTAPANTAKRIQMAGLGGFGGGALGFGIVLIIGALDRRLRHADDATSGLGAVRMLGVLPSLPENMSDPDQSVLAAHAVHHIRTLLQIGVEAQEGGRVFSVSGPAAGSGKTSLCLALSVSFANSDSKTLLIDADLVGGGLSHRLGAEVHRKLGKVLIEQGLITQTQYDAAARKAKATGTEIRQRLIEDGLVTEHQMRRALRAQQQTSLGLLDVCDGEPLEDCTAETGIGNLSILPIGAAMPHQAGALSPNALREVIASARQRYDIVLIDTGPVLGSLEASIAATEADGVVMIVSRGDPKRLAYKSLEHLMSLNAHIAGVVFNHALEDDVARTSYATLSVVQSRRQHARPTMDRVDPAKTARYGPLASAVASYGTSKGNNTPAPDDAPTLAADNDDFDQPSGARQAS